MQAAMGVAGPKAGKSVSDGPYAFASTKNPRGIDQRAFIDINYENSTGNDDKLVHQPPPTQPPLQGYAGYPPGPNQPYMQPPLNQNYSNHPSMPPSRQQNYQQYPPTQYYPGIYPPSHIQQHQMYNNPNISSSSAVGAGNRAQSLVSNRRRRNSNSSITTTSTVNRFMKKQWGRLGGGSGSKSSDKKYTDDDDDVYGNADFNISQGEISFDDITHLRGDRIGAFGLGDSTPYIPTLKQSVNQGQNISGEVYRKAQINQKKAMAANIVKQKQAMQQQQQQQQMIPPRSMSLQTSNQSRYAHYNGYPPQGVSQGVQQGMPQGVPQGMPQGISQGMPQGIPQGIPQGMPQGIPSQRMPQMYPENYQKYPPSQYNGQYVQAEPQGPRAMSLQTKMRGMPPLVTSVHQVPENFEKAPNSQQSQKTSIPQLTNEKENIPISAPEPPLQSKSKSVTRIDFSNLSDDDEMTHDVEILEQSSPIKSELRGATNVRGSNVESVVTFDSVHRVDHENHNLQKQLYGLKNNSTQQTVFYSANDFMSAKSTPQKSAPTVGLKEQPSKGRGVSVSALSESLDNMAINLTPVESSKDNTAGDIDDTLRYSTATIGSTQPLHVNDNQLSSPMKMNNLVDMNAELKSEQSTPMKKLPRPVNGSESSLSVLNFKKRAVTPVSKSTTSLETPSRGHASFSSEPRSPMSLGLSTPVSGFTPEQCGLLNDNTQLLEELELVTNELASAVSREIKLEGDLKEQKRVLKEKDLTLPASRKDGSDDNNTEFDQFLRGVKFLENGDVEVDEGIEKSTQYAATITKLAQLLNEERKKRYIIEETLLQSQESLDEADLRNQLLVEKSQVQQLTIKVNYLNESEKLHRMEKELLERENKSLKEEVAMLKKKYAAIKEKMKLSVSM